MRRRNHVNPLGPYFETFRGARPALRPGVETEVEIGCADAQFLFERAASEQTRNYVGLEIRECIVAEVNERAAAENAPVQAIFCNATLHLHNLFAPRSVSRVYVNFPDPWFKRRHRKRRMVSRGLAEKIARVVRPGGEVFVQTDVWNNALDMLSIFERLDQLYENVLGPWSFYRDDNPYGARSWRERHCMEEDLPIWRILYRSLAQG
jgi:tRNA (guanine-N7-)-methyltransferase